jgi:hypothetical protein
MPPNDHRPIKKRLTRVIFLPTIELRERLEKAAKEERRSMSNFVVNAVEEYLDLNYPVLEEDKPEDEADDGP